MEYPIATLIDMACIPDGPRARMLAELPAVLDNLHRLVRTGVPLQARDCRWTDDGDHECEIRVTSLSKRARPGTDARGAEEQRE